MSILTLHLTLLLSIYRIPIPRMTTNVPLDGQDEIVVFIVHIRYTIYSKVIIDQSLLPSLSCLEFDEFSVIVSILAVLLA
jgi:hypothetical protein